MPVAQNHVIPVGDHITTEKLTNWGLMMLRHSHIIITVAVAIYRCWCLILLTVSSGRVCNFLGVTDGNQQLYGSLWVITNNPQNLEKYSYQDVNKTRISSFSTNHSPRKKHHPLRSLGQRVWARLKRPWTPTTVAGHSSHGSLRWLLTMVSLWVGSLVTGIVHHGVSMRITSWVTESTAFTMGYSLEVAGWVSPWQMIMPCYSNLCWWHPTIKLLAGSSTSWFNDDQPPETTQETIDSSTDQARIDHLSSIDEPFAYQAPVIKWTLFRSSSDH